MHKPDATNKENKFTVIQGGGIVAIASLLGVMASSVLGGGVVPAPGVPVSAHAGSAPNGSVVTAPNGAVIAKALNAAGATQLSRAVAASSSAPLASSSSSHLTASPAVSGGATVAPTLSPSSSNSSAKPANVTVSPSASTPSISTASVSGQASLAADQGGPVRAAMARALSAQDSATTSQSTTTTTTATPSSYQIPGQLPASTPPPTDSSQPSAPTAGYVTAPAIGVGTLWGGESPAGNVSNAVNPGTDPIIHTSTGTWIQGPGGAMYYVGPPGFNPARPDYSQPSLNDVWTDLENQVRAGTLVVPSGVAEGDFIAQKAAQLMQGNPNTNNALYYATANPNSLGYHLFWNTSF
jgi:hypothetical protein